MAYVIVGWDDMMESMDEYMDCPFENVESCARHTDCKCRFYIHNDRPNARVEGNYDQLMIFLEDLLALEGKDLLTYRDTNVVADGQDEAYKLWLEKVVERTGPLERGDEPRTMYLNGMPHDVYVDWVAEHPMAPTQPNQEVKPKRSVSLNDVLRMAKQLQNEERHRLLAIIRGLGHEGGIR